jgi:DNA-binding MarR family transcriptional regulator
MLYSQRYKINGGAPMGVYKNYNYNIHTAITRAMSKYNKIMTGPRFNTLDGNILNLVRSFSETDRKFFMSNKELGEIMIADPSTVQRSVDRLIVVGLVQKEIVYVGSKPQRLLTYQKDTVKKILELD